VLPAATRAGAERKTAQLGGFFTAQLDGFCVRKMSKSQQNPAIQKPATRPVLRTKKDRTLGRF